MSRVFPDVEDVLRGLIVDAELAAHVGTEELPLNLQYRLPYVLITRAGGPDDGVTDLAVVDIEVYAAQKTNGKQLTEAIRQYMTGSPLGKWPIDRITTESVAQELPFGTRNVRRWSTTVRVACRRITT